MKTNLSPRITPFESSLTNDWLNLSQKAGGAAIAACLAGIALFAGATQAHGQTTFTWTTETVSTTSTATWATGSNWVGGTAPTGTVNLDFSGETISAGITRTSNNNIAGLSVNTLTNGSASSGSSAILNFTGNAITWVQDGSSNNPKIQLNGTGTTQLLLNSSVASGVNLQINGSANTNFSLGSGASGIISGAGSVTNNRTTGQTITGSAHTFSGGFTLNSGTLAVGASSSGSANAPTSGPVGTGTFTINGGTIRVSGGVLRTLHNTVNIGGNFTVGTSGQNSSITLVGDTVLKGTAVTRTITGAFDAFNGATDSTSTGVLTFAGNISEEGAGNGLTLATTGSNQTANHFVFSGTNTYTGNTTINTSATFTLVDTGSLKFSIGSNGVNNQVLGSGTANFNGSFVLDLSGAGSTLGDSWTLVNVGTLSESFSGTFFVSGFTDNLDNTWSKVNGGTTYTFVESTGILSVTATSVPEPSSYALFCAGCAATLVLVRRKKRNPTAC